MLPANTTYPPNVRPMLGQRRRRWPSIGQTLGRCIVFAGACYRRDLAYLYSSVGKTRGFSHSGVLSHWVLARCPVDK